MLLVPELLCETTADCSTFDPVPTRGTASWPEEKHSTNSHLAIFALRPVEEEVRNAL